MHLCWCQTGIGFESRNQRAFIVHGYICLIDVFSAAHMGSVHVLDPTSRYYLTLLNGRCIKTGQITDTERGLFNHLLQCKGF